jgi:hypothetical protein
MTYKSANYTPQAKSRKILEAAWQHVNSIPYQATLRWLFYRLLQDGFYSKKEDYHGAYMALMSTARHNEFEGWRPDTLADDMRESIVKTGGYQDVNGWAASFSNAIYKCNIDPWYGQTHYVELWFEANAMVRQFEHYTNGITLRPMGGQPSIPYKYSIAMDLERLATDYDLPITILYFGDYDAGGLQIGRTIEEHVREWCSADFDFVRCGINEGDAQRYHIPENFERPGSYQWEALTDNTARELITGALARYVDYDAWSSSNAAARRAGAVMSKYMKGFEKFFSHGAKPPKGRVAA